MCIHEQVLRTQEYCGGHSLVDGGNSVAGHRVGWIIQEGEVIAVEAVT